MSNPLFLHRLQFAFTIVYHYLFPNLTMGLAFLIFVMKALGLRRGGEAWNDAARFWIRIFGINFAIGVVTGIPMEFQFGTNWAGFSRYAGNVVGHTLGMEGLFAFFLESSFLSLLVFGEKRLSRVGHFLAAAALFAGSWISGYFITATNAFMQHPAGQRIGADGRLYLESFGAFVLNPWALAQYAHNMTSTVVTGSFVVTALGAFYLLQERHVAQARLFLRIGLTVGLISSLFLIFPTGDRQAKLVARYQPVSLAAMEGRFESGPRAEINLIGQPNVAERKLDNPVAVPGVLSMLAFGHFYAPVQGLSDFPERDWPDNIELLYYAFHIMAGLGTILIGVMALANLLAWTRRLEKSRAMLWVLMLSFPFPYIAVTAGWLTAELGRQPWLVYGLFRTAQGASPTVHAGTTLFTLIGFCGLYTVLSVLFLYLVAREIGHGPHAPKTPDPASGRKVVHA
ncbi:MAG TPA: cytochrome ubiquinol oxidase subunit I [Thermoanaerobaculia bacterium]